MCNRTYLVKSFFDIVTSLLKFKRIYRKEVTREKEDQKFASSYSRRNRGWQAQDKGRCINVVDKRNDITYIVRSATKYELYQKEFDDTR